CPLARARWRAAGSARRRRAPRDAPRRPSHSAPPRRCRPGPAAAPTNTPRPRSGPPPTFLASSQLLHHRATEPLLEPRRPLLLSLQQLHRPLLGVAGLLLVALGGSAGFGGELALLFGATQGVLELRVALGERLLGLVDRGVRLLDLGLGLLAPRGFELARPLLLLEVFEALLGLRLRSARDALVQLGLLLGSADDHERHGGGGQQQEQKSDARDGEQLLEALSPQQVRLDRVREGAHGRREIALEPSPEAEELLRHLPRPEQPRVLALVRPLARGGPQLLEEHAVLVALLQPAPQGEPGLDQRLV